MSDGLVRVRQSTAETFLPPDYRSGGKIDLKALAKVASDAMRGSDESLQQAQRLINKGKFSQWWNNGEIQKNFVESIRHVRDLSKVNLALSAICNDLAAENLEQAKRIDANHRETFTSLEQIKELTTELLAHLKGAEGSSVSGQASPDDVEGKKSTMQRLAHLERQVARHCADSSAEFERLRERHSEIAGLMALVKGAVSAAEETLERYRSDSLRQTSSQSGRLTDLESKLAEETEATHQRLSELHARIALAAGTLGARMVDVVEEAKSGLRAESEARAGMQKALLALLERQESDWRKRLLRERRQGRTALKRVGGILLALQGAAFVFLAVKAGVI